MKRLKKYQIVAIAAIMVCFLGALLYFILTSSKASTAKPHIIIIIADDLGYNDVSFHGSAQIPTPNLANLATKGIILDRFYTQATCTPSRTALLTGNYPIRSGMQGYPLKAGENRSLPQNMPTMPLHFKNLGYKTHLVGKWHLGAAYRQDTPLGKGFDSHFGYWNGFVGYFDYLAFSKMDNGTLIKGLDLHDQFEPVWGSQGRYATELFTEKSLEIIERHDVGVPLFMVVSHLAAHTGQNGTELGVPDVDQTNHKFAYIQAPRRRLYAEIVSQLDASIGRILAKLDEKQMLDNSIVLFFSDNGAQSVGMYENSGSNWPLRGVKFSDFEGGVRVAAAIYSPLLRKMGYVSDHLIHITDWLPTLFSAAGGDVAQLGKIDGIDQWDALSNNNPSNRSEILVNIDEVDNNFAIIWDKFKLLQGSYNEGLFDQYYGESGREPENPTPNPNETTVDLSWCRTPNQTPILNCTGGCLFDLDKDPCETTNIIDSEPEIAKQLYEKIEKFWKELVPQRNKDTDPKSDPIFYNNTWCTWLEDAWCYKTTNIERIS
ncbi:arylsulfatase B-like [Tribolium madens]|uniref:arylsulfatase B-like n=1 Tax=Tribolium madens TaxID=41895 RepID=UPI001CF73ED4|nr:arylsulfatase B-like [Tribolium madens]